jgi:hypothetical protein
MSPDKISAWMAIFAALFVVVASNKQWWTVSYDGVLVTKRWANRLLAIVTGLLLTSAVALWPATTQRALVVVGIGLVMSCVAGWFVGSWIHDWSVAAFKAKNAGIAGAPLAGGDFD